MIAVVQSAYGDPRRVLRLRDVPTPCPAAGEVLVRVTATSVNTPDWAMVTGVPLALRARFGLPRPRVPVRGSDVVGVVDALGAGVTGVAVGDAVFGSVWPAFGGAFAEHVAVPATQVVPTPAGLDPTGAACAMSGLTALAAIRDVGAVEAGMSVLVNGASGGVGTFAVQIARHLGATVTGVCGPTNTALVSSLGADRVIDHTTEDLTGAYDVILDNVLNHPPARTARLLTPTGVLIPNSLGTTGGLLGALPRMARASLMRSRARFADCAVDRPALTALADLLGSGAVRTVVDRVHPFAETADAVAHMATHRARGKVVVTGP